MGQNLSSSLFKAAKLPKRKKTESPESFHSNPLKPPKTCNFTRVFHPLPKQKSHKNLTKKNNNTKIPQKTTKTPHHLPPAAASAPSYVLLEQIGEGSSGRVHRGLRKFDEQQVPQRAKSELKKKGGSFVGLLVFVGFSKGFQGFFGFFIFFWGGFKVKKKLVFYGFGF